MATLTAQGTTITFADTVPTPQTVGGVASFSFGNGSASDIDVSNLSSTAREYAQGLVDFGELTLEFAQRDPNDAGQAEMESAKSLGATREVVITLPGGDIATFNAYVKTLSSEGGVDAVLTGSATLKVTGAIVWS